MARVKLRLCGGSRFLSLLPVPVQQEEPVSKTISPRRVVMKNPDTCPLMVSQYLRQPLAAISALVFALALCACSKQEDGTTAGQQLDSAIAKTEQAAAQAKAKTESTMAEAGTALKDATQGVKASGQVLASKAAEKFDDMGITAAVAAGLAKDPDLRALAINVDTKNGAVVLKGSAPTDAAREKAAAIAKAVKGVTSVDNQLVVKAG